MTKEEAFKEYREYILSKARKEDRRMTNFEWLAQSSNLIDFLYDLTNIAKNEEDVFLFNVLKNWDIPRIPNHTGQWAIAKWLVSLHKEKNIFDGEESIEGEEKQ